MCTYTIQVQFQRGFAEVLPDDPEKTELAIEDVMSRVLLKLFDGGMVEEVTLQSAPGSPVKWSWYILLIRLKCPCQHFLLTPRTQENVRGEVKKNTYRVLKELFASVEVANITRVAAPWQSDECYIY